MNDPIHISGRVRGFNSDDTEVVYLSATSDDVWAQYGFEDDIGYRVLYLRMPIHEVADLSIGDEIRVRCRLSMQRAFLTEEELECIPINAVSVGHESSSMDSGQGSEGTPASGISSTPSTRDYLTATPTSTPPTATPMFASPTPTEAPASIVTVNSVDMQLFYTFDPDGAKRRYETGAWIQIGGIVGEVRVDPSSRPHITFKSSNPADSSRVYAYFGDWFDGESPEILNAFRELDRAVTGATLSSLVHANALCKRVEGAEGFFSIDIVLEDCELLE